MIFDVEEESVKNVISNWEVSVSTFSQKEVSFKLNLSYRSLKCYCITGLIGILYVTLSTLFFADVRNKFFYITLIVWNTYSLLLFGSGGISS
jgi:hypothetical protein